MARPPRQIFQKTATGITEITENVKEKIKKNTIKYFLLFFLATEILSFFLEIINPIFYYEILFNVFIQSQFLVLFLFLLRFNFCPRNKIIIYFLLGYFLSNIILPFFVTNEIYTNLIKNVTILLLSILLTLTIKIKNETLN